MDTDLKFREDGTFKIAQFTDMHLGDVNGGSKELEKDVKTLSLIEQVIEHEKPDLIVLTGDLIWSRGNSDPQKSFRRAIAPTVSSKIPWAAVFGNHDAEAGVTKEELLAIQLESEMCVTQPGPAELNGLGNFIVTIKYAGKSEDAAVLYFLDSGMDAPKHIGGYDWIHSNQVEWYKTQARLLNQKHGGALPALAFFHIPLPEYEEAWLSDKVNGIKHEKVCCPKYNSGLFTAIVEAGDVIGTFVGHDHDNDYCGTMQGIQLCYGRITGYNCYGSLERGARIIRLYEGQRIFETWLRLNNGKTSE